MESLSKACEKIYTLCRVYLMRDLDRYRHITIYALSMKVLSELTYRLICEFFEELYIETLKMIYENILLY